jgi:hypothetical protein
MLVAGIIFLVLSNFANDINDAVQLEPDISVEAKVVSEEQAGATSGFFDSAVVIVFVGVWLLCLGLAYNSGSSPMLMVVAILVIVALGFTSMILSNTWDDLAGDESFSATRDTLPMTGFLLDHYLLVCLTMGFSTLVIGVSKGGGF